MSQALPDFFISRAGAHPADVAMAAKVGQISQRVSYQENMYRAEPSSCCHRLRSRHASVTVWPCPIPIPIEMLPQQPPERRFRSAIRVPDLWLVLNDDFGPAASHMSSSPGETD
jgi:hypothetical protein